MPRSERVFVAVFLVLLLGCAAALELAHLALRTWVVRAVWK